MLTSVEGVYRNGHVELSEVPENVTEESKVIVTFVPAAILPRGHVLLADHGISKEQAAELRASLSTFADDWDSPEMDIYDDYEAILAKRSAR